MKYKNGLVYQKYQIVFYRTEKFFLYDEKYFVRDVYAEAEENVALQHFSGAEYAFAHNFLCIKNKFKL